ncbi:MAG TPA: hypothetical protein VEQ11_07235 [Chloroflexota bacterium]|nr:hypothetical protein [Chloroflexota bacterium]
MRAGRAEPAMIERTRLAEESKLPEIADLVRRAQRGDSSAFQALYDEYAPAVFRFLARRVDGPLETLEDLT